MRVSVRGHGSRGSLQADVVRAARDDAIAGFQSFDDLHEIALTRTDLQRPALEQLAFQLGVGDRLAVFIDDR